MAEVRLTNDALRDIEEIRAYIAQDSARYADRQIQRFYAEIIKLERFPYSGRIVPEIHEYDLRQVQVGSYRIIYRVISAELVEVLIIYHSARNFPFRRFT